MVDYNELRLDLIRQIEEEKGFSFKKLMRIIELNGILKGMQ